jgi:hypothetical protein
MVMAASSALVDPRLKADVAERVERGIAACKARDWERAVRLLEGSATDLGSPDGLPPRALAYYGLALAATRRRSPSEAIAFCEAALRRDCLDVELHLVTARVCQQAGLRTRALKVVRAGLRVEPDSLALRRLEGQLGGGGRSGGDSFLGRLLGRLRPSGRR